MSYSGWGGRGRSADELPFEHRVLNGEHVRKNSRCSVEGGIWQRVLCYEMLTMCVIKHFAYLVWFLYALSHLIVTTVL